MINPGIFSQNLGAPQQVANAVQNASAKTGIDFSYLLTQAKVESSFDTDVKAKGSSATGLYQFIDQTWLRMVKEHGAEHGKAGWAAAITQDRGGHLSVKGGMKAEILNGRKDAGFSSLMAAEFAGENKQTLESKLGRSVNSTDLYMAHFLGAGGASTFLSALDDNPLQSAARLFPDAARSNRGVFFNADGSPRTLSQVYDRFAAKFENASGQPNSVMVKAQPKQQNDAVAMAAAEPIDAASIMWQTPSRIAGMEQDGEKSGFSNPFAGAYNLIKSPIQTMIGNDMVSTPLLSWFSREGDRSYASRDGDDSRKANDFSFNA